MADLLFIQAILGHNHIGLENAAVRRVFPHGQTHVLLVAIRIGIDDFRRRLPGDGIVKAILYHGVKVMCGRRITVVVQTALGKNIGNLLPDAAFTGADEADALQQFTEMVVTENRTPLFEAFVIQSCIP